MLAQQLHPRKIASSNAQKSALFSFYIVYTALFGYFCVQNLGTSAPCSSNTRMTANEFACGCKVVSCSSQVSDIYWVNKVFHALLESLGASASCLSNTRITAKQPTHGEDHTLNILDLQIIQFFWILFWVTGTPVTHVKPCLINPVWDFGDSRETCLIFMGTPAKTCGNLGSRNYFESDLLCLWARIWLQSNMRVTAKQHAYDCKATCVSLQRFPLQCSTVRHNTDLA